jgi:hypothetical protein
MKQIVFKNADEVMDFVCTFWSDATLDAVEPAFRKWMKRSERVCGHYKE